MVSNKHFKIISIIFGLILLIAGILLILIKPDTFIAYPVTLIGIGSYVFAVSLASILLTKMYYSSISAVYAQRNKFIRMVEIFTYCILGIVMAITIILCFTLLK